MVTADKVEQNIVASSIFMHTFLKNKRLTITGVFDCWKKASKADL